MTFMTSPYETRVSPRRKRGREISFFVMALIWGMSFCREEGSVPM